MKKISDIGERQLVERFKRRYKQDKRTIVGIGDDAAIVKVSKNKLLVVTSDMLVEGVHFLRKEAAPYEIGWKAIGASLSDIAAMAALPKTAVVSLGLPPFLSIGFVDELTRGIEAMARLFNVNIVGGDTVSSPNKIIISVSVIGEIEKKNLILRKGAQLGDKILVTGSLGGSRKSKQYRFIPRIKEARWLVKNADIHSMMDISDGLGIDLYRLITASKVSGRLYKEAVPVSYDARGIDGALMDGEDFELLFTISASGARKLLKKWKNKKAPITIVGEIIRGKQKVELVDKFGKIKKLIPKGYEHFTNY